MNGRWPIVLLALTLVLAALVFGVNRRQSNDDINALKKVLGEQICRQVAQSRAYKPTKDIPKALIDQSIRSLQQERADLGLPLCK